MLTRFVAALTVAIVLLAAGAASAQGVPQQLQQLQSSLTTLNNTLTTLSNSVTTVTSIVNGSGDGKTVITQSGVMAAGGFPYQITRPGSYRLADNLTAPPDTDAIQIQTDHVTLDLNGFTISGSGGNGIIAPNGQSFITVTSGTLDGFTAGVFFSGNGNPTRVERMTIRGRSVSSGIGVGDGAIVVDNSVDSSSLAGIFAGFHSVVRGNVVRNSIVTGIEVHAGSVVSGNTVSGNTFSTTPFTGFSIDCPSVVTGNTSVLGNGSGSSRFFGSGCAVADNAGF
jgi:hypothetical protein